jgi:hypothetical protein
MNHRSWNAFNLFGTIFSLDSPVLWLPAARSFWTHGPLPGLNRLADIPADWTLWSTDDANEQPSYRGYDDTGMSLSAQTSGTYPDTPRKDPGETPSAIKPRSDVEIHLKDPLVLVSPRHARTLPFPPSFSCRQAKAFQIHHA